MGFYSEKIFPIVLDVTTRAIQQERAEVLAEASGSVLEIGVGTGANLEFYPVETRRVVGLEPSAGMLRKASSTAEALSDEDPAAREVSLLQGGADQMPFEDESFDTVVACLVFCSIVDAPAAAREMFRVLKPDGKLVFFEHVLSPDARLARWQGRLTPIWRRLGCGCELDRDTRRLFESCGFELDSQPGYYHPKMMKLASYILRGTGYKRARA